MLGIPKLPRSRKAPVPKQHLKRPRMGGLGKSAFPTPRAGAFPTADAMGPGSPAFAAGEPAGGAPAGMPEPGPMPGQEG